MNKLLAYFQFYKGIFILPTTITVWLIILDLPLTVLILTKIMIFALIWLFKYLEDPTDKKFYFYYNIGISKINLFSISFLIDFILFIITKRIY